MCSARWHSTTTGKSSGSSVSSYNSRCSRKNLVGSSTESSEPSTPIMRAVSFLNQSEDSSESSTPTNRVVSFMQGLTERRPSNRSITRGRRESLAQALENSILKKTNQYRRRSSLKTEPSLLDECRRCFPCTVASGYSGIPLLVRQRGSNGGGAPGIATARGRRASTTGGPRRPLSRRQSRRESRRGSKGRRRSSVHPPIHLPNKDGETSEDEREEKPKNPIRRLSRMLSNAGPALVRRVSKLRRKSLAHQELEDFELAPLRYRPEGLEQLSKATRFTKEELQFMYRGFKQECPTGVISEETFKTIYGKFFPLGDTAMYAHYVFGTLDQDGSGSITFGDFIMGLSVLLKGTLQERVNWIFNLYDINNDGYITKEELIDIVTSIYDLMGDEANPGIDDNTAVHHVDKIFQKLDLNNDGVVTMDEFMEYCSKNENVIHSLNLFDEIQ
ncbi:A-type potassium channel modulatory protein KCNIP2-like isoform X2 [Palaemon carinicauda]|uniref:A-type potassium channel modulatory protein KCNIP2-like isoform X2 n=1 Tax=Palaemon carinicauda TaxID=392227 RepID=UPI0035B6A6B4